MRKSHNGGISIRSKLWLEGKDGPVFGRGRRQLLEEIDRLGSISRAARAIDVSYRRAWSYVRSMEERLGIKLVVRRTGGRDGGGAALTDDARDFVERYRALEEGIMEMVDRRYAEVFGKGGFKATPGGRDV